MEENFSIIYKDLVNEYGNKFKNDRKFVTTKKMLYVLFAWIIFSFIETIISTLGYSGSIIYLLFQALSAVSICLLIIFVFFTLNLNMNYWKKAFEFKNDVGKKFWKKINENVDYIPERTEINIEETKKELYNLYENSVIIDVEDYLKFEDLKMYTIRFNTKDKKRLTGTFVIIDNINKILEKEELNNLNLEIVKDIINITQKNNKLYLLLDAKEVFYFNNVNFFSEKELLGNYIRFYDLLKIKESFN